MRSLDLIPLYRSVIGADLMARMLDGVDFTDNNSYPPYNIEIVDENRYKNYIGSSGFHPG